MSQKVTVETIALTSTPASPAKSSDVRDRPNEQAVRWVLSSASAEGMFSWAAVAVIGFAVLVSAIVLQRYLTVTGSDALAPLRSLRELGAPTAVPPLQRPAGSEKYLDIREAAAHAGNHPPSSTASIAKPSPDAGIAAVKDAVEKAEQAVPPSAAPEEAKASSLAELVAAHGSSDSGPGSSGEASGVQKIVLVSPHGDKEGHASVVVQDAGHEAVQGAKRFGELAESERTIWLERLKKAGHWIEDEGVTVLEGVFFSEFAQGVGGALRDAVVG